MDLHQRKGSDHIDSQLTSDTLDLAMHSLSKIYRIFPDYMEAIWHITHLFNVYAACVRRELKGTKVCLIGQRWPFERSPLFLASVQRYNSPTVSTSPGTNIWKL
jgi:hypothetical protein